MARTKRRRKNPDDKELLSRIVVEFKKNGSEPGLWYVVALEDGETEVANAEFLLVKRRDGTKLIRGEMIEVADGYQRKGLASLLVREIEKKSGRSIYVPPGEFSWEGQNFWLGRRKNPDDAELLAKLKISSRWYGGVFIVKALLGKLVVGQAKFETTTLGPKSIETRFKLSAEDLWVLEGYRRRGIASAIYRHVSQRGYWVAPSLTQTHDGKALWDGGRWSTRELYRHLAFPWQYPDPR